MEHGGCEKAVAVLKRRGYEAGAVADGTDWLVVKPMAKNDKTEE